MSANKNYIVLALAAALASHAANAQSQSKVVYVDDKTPSAVAAAPQVVQTASYSNVTQTGTSPKAANTLVGHGTNIPMALALQQIIPESLKVETKDVTLGVYNVSWKADGSRSWLFTLNVICQLQGLRASVDWHSNKVTFTAFNTQPPPLSASIATPTPQVKKPAPAAIPSGPSWQPSMPSTPQAVVQTQWTLDPALSLRENVERWTAAAGWSRVIWNASDYVVVSKASFTGRFDSPDGPLAQVIRAYDQSEQPLMVRLMTKDRVVEVRNKSFELTPLSGPTSPSALDPEIFK